MPTTHPRRTRRDHAPGPVRASFEARLLYPTGHGQRSLVVECHPTGQGVVIRLPEFNEAGHYLQDAPVTVVAVSSGAVVDAPVIVGRSHAMADRDVDPDTVSALEQWPAGIRAHYFAITPTDPPMPDPPTTGPGRTGPGRTGPV